MTVGNNCSYLGWQSAIGIAKQTTNTTFVTSTAFVEFNSESMKQEREEIKLGSINTDRAIRHRLIGNESNGGGLEVDLDPASDGVINIIKQAMGGTMTSIVNPSGASDYIHTLYAGDMVNNATSGAVDMKGLSIAVRKGTTNVWDFSSCHVNTLNISAEVGGQAVVSAEFIALSVTSSATIGASAVAFSGYAPVNFTGVTLKTGDSITNVSAEYFTSLEFSLNNNLDGDQRVLGSRNAVCVPTGQREVTVTLNQRYDTLTAYNRFIENTLTALELTFDNAQTTTAGSFTSSLVIKLPEAYWNTSNPEVGGAEALAVETEVSAIYGSEATYDVQMVVQNATASYD